MSQKKYALSTPLPLAATRGLTSGLVGALRQLFGVGRPAWHVRGPAKAVNLSTTQSWTDLDVSCADRFDTGLYLVMFQCYFEATIAAPDTLAFSLKLQLDGADYLGDHPATEFQQPIDDAFPDLVLGSFWELALVNAGAHSLRVLAYWESLGGTMVLQPNMGQLLVKQL